MNERKPNIKNGQLDKDTIKIIACISFRKRIIIDPPIIEWATVGPYFERSNVQIKVITFTILQGCKIMHNKSMTTYVRKPEYPNSNIDKEMLKNT